MMTRCSVKQGTDRGKKAMGSRLGSYVVHRLASVLCAALFLMGSPASAEELSDHISGTSRFSFLKSYRIDHVERDRDKGVVTVQGTLNGHHLSVSQGLSKKTAVFTIAADTEVSLPDILPLLQGVPGLDRLKFESLKAEEARLAFTATVQVADAVFSLDLDLKEKSATLDVKNGGATLADFIPELAHAPAVNGIKVRHFFCDLTTKKVDASGALSDVNGTFSIDASGGLKKMVVDLSTDNEKASFTLGKAVPELENAPVVNAFGLNKLKFDLGAKTLTATVSVNQAQGTLTVDASKGLKKMSMDMKATSGTITLGQVVPELAHAPVVNILGFGDLSFDLDTKVLSATTSINDAESTLTVNTAKGRKNMVVSLTATKDKITLGQMIPELANTPVVNDFAFEGATYKLGEKTLTATAWVNDAEGTLKVDASKGRKKMKVSLTATKDKITLGQMIPELAKTPVVNDFAFETLVYDMGKKTLTADAKVNDAEGELSFDTSAGRSRMIVSLESKSKTGTFTLGQIITDLADKPVVNDFAFETLVYDMGKKTLTADAKVNDAEGELSFDTSAGRSQMVVTLKSQAGKFTLGQVIPKLADTPVVNDFAFKTLLYDMGKKSLWAALKLNETGAVFSIDTSKGAKNLVASVTADTKGGIRLGQVVSSLEKVPAVNNFAFVSLTCNLGEKKLTGEGLLGTTGVSLSLAKEKGSKIPNFTLDSTDGTTGITLGDAIPPLGKLPGVNAFSFTSMTLKDKSITADLGFNEATANLALTIGSYKDALKSMDLTITPDKGKIELDTLFPELAHLPGVKDFDLEKLEYDEETGSLVTTLTIGNSTATLTLDREGQEDGEGQGDGDKGERVFKLTADKLGLGTFVSSLKNVPLLGEAGFAELEISSSFISASAKIEKIDITLVENVKKGFAAIDFGALELSSIIPKVKGTVLEGVKLASSLFVISKKEKKIEPKDFPPDKRSLLSGVDFSKAFKQGVNLAGSITKDGLGKLGDVLKKLNMAKDKIPVSGFMPSNVFKLIAHHAKTKSKDKTKEPSPPKDFNVPDFLKKASFSFDVPIPEIPGMKKFATFDDAIIAVNGDMGSGSLWNKVPDSLKDMKPKEGELDISLQGGMKFTIDKFEEDLQLLANLNVVDKALSIQMLGLATGQWDKAFGIKGLKVKDGGFDIKISGGGGTAAKLDLGFFGTAQIHNKDNVGLSANFEESGGLPKLLYMEADGPISLSDFGLKLPGDSNVTMHKILLYPKGIEADVSFKSGGFKERNKLYIFEMEIASKEAFVAAVDLTLDVKTNNRTNFSFGELAKIAPLKGTGAEEITANLNGMASAKAALILSSIKVFPVEPKTLKDGIAKDMFEGIFGDSQVPVKIDNVTIVADFQANLMGDVGQALTKGVKGLKLGLSGDAVINGSIGGLFDSDPLNLDLEFLMGESLTLANLKKSGLTLPKALKLNPDTLGADQKLGVFLKIDDVTAEVGLLAGFGATIDNTSFDFTGTIGAQLAEDEVGISISGAMSDNWKNALGIKGFELESVTVTGEVEADPPSLKFGMGAETTILGHDYQVAGDAIVGLAGEVPIPEGIGFSTSTNKLDKDGYKILNTGQLIVDSALSFAIWPELIIAGIAGEVLSAEIVLVEDAVKGKKVTFKDMASGGYKNLKWGIKELSTAQAWFISGEDVFFSFATPGASDANLAIGDGVRFGGKFSFFGGKVKTPKLNVPSTWIYKIINKLSKGKDKDKDEDDETPANGTPDSITRVRGMRMMAAMPGANGIPAKSHPSAANDKRTIPGKIIKDLCEVIGYELGLRHKAPSFDYPKPTKKELEEFKRAFNVKLPDFKLGGLTFTGPKFSMFPFQVTAKAKIFGAEEDVVLKIIDGSLAMELKTSLAGIGSGELVLEYDRPNDDFVVIGELKGDSGIQEWLAKEIRNGINEISKTAGAKYDILHKDLAAAQKVRDLAEKGLNQAQKAAQKVTKAAVGELRKVTNAYHASYQKAQHNYDHCHGWKKYYCKAKWWARKGLAYDTWKASEALLHDAEKALAEEKALAVEVHKAQIKFNKAANDVALVLKDVETAANIKGIIEVGLSKFAKSSSALATAFEFKEGFLAGSIRDLAKGKPLVLEAYFTIEGKKYKEYFALSPEDLAFNALSFGLLPVIAAEHIVTTLEEDLEKDLSKTLHIKVPHAAEKLINWIQAHIYELTGALREGLEKKIANIEYELKQEESKYKKVLDSLEAHSGKFLDGYKDLTNESNQILSTYKLTDFMPSSDTFTRRYLAVGHSSLCLGVATNGVDVYQENCKDVSAEQWTALSIKNDDGNPSGYVQMMSKGLCLKAQTSDAQSGQPLVLAKCNGTDDHEKWKIVSQDGFYNKVVNRFSGKCLHFDTENANAKTGYSVWTSCFGSDSQGFRVIKDAEKPAFYAVEDEIEAKNGLCLASDPDFKQYFEKTKKGHSTTDRQAHNRMQQKKDHFLVATGCDSPEREQFNYLEEVNGDLKLVHVASGWCVVPQEGRGDGLVLAPCDSGKDMFWRTRDRDGSAFEMLNLGNGKCMTLSPTGSKAGAPRSGTATLTNCERSSSQYIDFVKK